MKINYFLLVIFTFFLCISLAEIATSDETIRKNFFIGRSADIILKSKNFFSKRDSLLIRLDENKVVSEPILDVDIAFSLWAPSHGVEAFTSGKLPKVEGNDLFTKTKLNLLFAFDNIGKSVLSKFPSLKILEGEQRSLLQSGYGEDSISMLTSIISGADPSTHGIIGSKWQSRNGHLQSAFRSPNTMSVINNYPDLLSKLFVGRSIVFGASFDFQIASALSAHPVLYADHPFWNDYGFYFDPTLDSFESLYPFAVFEPELMLSKAKMVSKWSTKLASNKIEITFDNQRMNIDISENDIFATFSAENTEEFSLIAEIRFVFTALEMFSSKDNWKKLIQDDSPDYISFGFSSLNKIKTLYGVDSTKFKAALFAVDALISHTVATFKNLYSNSVHSHAIFVSPDEVQFSKEVKNVVSQTLSSSLSVSKSSNLPYIYTNNLQPLSLSCSTLGKQLTKFDVEVYCPGLNALGVSYPVEEADEIQPYLYILESLGNSSSNSTITYNDVFVFQIMFWFTIAIILALLCGSCAVYVVDIPRQSNLIRQLPNIYHDPHQQKNLW